ncbi:hypothetical protein LCGC14_0443760 [marine sediment metagenome]|uniref:HTH marR-type domain-containing protein n=1 Tax=marine sediment metagenome TaxID=412755 RepID=A0A0F9SJQ9_9ZZZZ
MIVLRHHGLLRNTRLELVDATALAPDTIRYSLHRLEAIGAVRIYGAQGGNRGSRPLVYTLTDRALELLRG